MEIDSLPEPKSHAVGLNDADADEDDNETKVADICSDAAADTSSARRHEVARRSRSPARASCVVMARCRSVGVAAANWRRHTKAKEETAQHAIEKHCTVGPQNSVMINWCMESKCKACQQETNGMRNAKVNPSSLKNSPACNTAPHRHQIVVHIRRRQRPPRQRRRAQHQRAQPRGAQAHGEFGQQHQWQVVELLDDQRGGVPRNDDKVKFEKIRVYGNMVREKIKYANPKLAAKRMHENRASPQLAHCLIHWHTQ